jgi:hypothetical protein
MKTGKIYLSFSSFRRKQYKLSQDSLKRSARNAKCRPGKGMQTLPVLWCRGACGKHAPPNRDLGTSKSDDQNIG